MPTPTRIAILLALAAPGLLVPGSAAAVQPATHVVISEVLYNTNTEHEWIELHNPTSQPVVIDGWSVDDGAGEGSWRITPMHPRLNYGIAPGGSIVIAQTASTFMLNHCLAPDFALVVGASGAVPVELTSAANVQLGNNGDQVYLRDDGGVILDAVEWEEQIEDEPLLYPIAKSSAAWQSAVRSPPGMEGDEAAGELSERLSQVWSHVRTRSIADPSDCTPDTSTIAHAGPTTGGLIKFPYVAAVTVPSAEAGTGWLEMTVQGEAFLPGATVSFSGTGIEVRASQWVSSQAINIVIDVRPSAASGPRDVIVTQPDGYSDTAPGLFTLTSHIVRPAAQAVISELLIDAPAGDPAGEWIELHNPTADFVILDGWEVSDGAAVWTLPDPVPGHDELILKPGQSVTVANDGDAFAAVYGKDPDFARLPGATDAWGLSESGGTLELADANGRVHLYDGAGLLVDAVAWGLTQAADAPTYPLYYGPAQGETLLRMARHDEGREQGGPLNEQLVEAFEVSSMVTEAHEGPETGGLQATPIVTAVTPVQAEQGQQGVVMHVTGRNFEPNAVLSITDTGITFDSVTVVSSTEIQAVLDVDYSAPASLRDVVVTNPGGYAGWLPHGFRVVAPVPRILGITPAQVNQGERVTLTFTGENTHFTHGDSQVLLGNGTGYAVEDVQVVSMTELTATVQFLLDAAPSPPTWDVRVSTASFSESAVGTGLLEIVPLPRIEAVSPAQGDQAQALTVSLTGRHTHFTQGTPVVDFGADIAVSGVQVTSDTTLSADLAIGDFAALGPRTVQVTTGGELAVSPEPVFEVLPRPAVKTVTPSTAFQGDALYVTLEGINTSWIASTSAADFGAGVTVRSLTVNGSASAVAEIRVDAAATPGPRTVTVTTGTEVAEKPDAFTVEGRPLVTAVAPSTVVQNTAGNVLTLTGVFTDWDATSTVSFSDAGLVITDVTVIGPTQLQVTVDVAAAAPLGRRDVVVTTGSQVALGTGSLQVAALVYLSAVSPSRVTQAQTVTIEVTGVNTSFQDGVSTVSLGAGVSVNAVSVTSPSRLLAEITVDPAAALGPRDVAVTTAAETATGAALFHVDPLPYVDVVSPGAGLQARFVTVEVTGVNTHFDAGSFVSFGGGIAVTDVTVHDASRLTAELALAATAALGPRDVTVVTGGEVARGAGLFEVFPQPRILSVTPDSGHTGETVEVAVVGEHTHFDATTSVSFGAGTSVGAVTVTDATHLSVPVTVSGKAASGLRDVVVTTGGEVVTAFEGFTVLLRPRLSRILPSSAHQGDRLTLAVEGQGTAFAEGEVALSLGDGVAVEAVRVAGTLRFEADVVVEDDAAPGARDVVVTAGGVEYVLAGGFSVQPTPRVVSVSPATGRRGEALTVSLVGENTTWGPGTNAVFGDGVVVSDTRCDDPTHCDVDLTLDANARLGTRDVTVMVALETARGVAAFEVLPTAEIVQVFPQRAVQGQSLMVTVVVSGTGVAAGTDAVSLGSGVVVESLDVSEDGSTATLEVTVEADAGAGPRTVEVQTTDAGVLRADLFRVDGLAGLRSVTPSQVPQGGQATLTVVGERTHFQTGLTFVNPGEGVRVTELVVTDAETLTVTILAAPDAVLGPRDLEVSTGTEVAVGEGSLEVVEAGSIDPDGGAAAGGCGCATQGGGDAGASALLLGLGLLLVRRRRRLAPGL